MMQQYGLGLQEAFDRIGVLHRDLETRFLAEFEKLPHFPEESDLVNRQLREYADALGNWVRANDQWSFEVSTLLFCMLFFCLCSPLLISDCQHTSSC